MNSFQKAIGLLSLFSETDRSFSVEDLSKRSGLPAPTVYRYTQNLRECGLLVQIRPGVLSLGPRIAELDRLMRKSDPLLIASEVVFPEALNNIRPSALLLSRYTGRDTVLAIRTEATHDAGRDQGYKRERGVPYSPLKGASSLVILAHRSSRTIAHAYSRDPEYIREVGMGKTLQAFIEHLAGIRRRGFARTTNSFSTGRTSIAIPIFDDSGHAEASLARILENARYEEIGETALLKDLRSTWERFQQEISGQSATRQMPRRKACTSRRRSPVGS
jgi:DNA-binding IclR family transcriptional regulator